MTESLLFVLQAALKLLFIFTPFLIMTIFLGLTRDDDDARRRSLALRATAAIGLISGVVYFFGPVVFALFGITLDAFRIGAGALLFLSAVGLVQGRARALPDGQAEWVVVPFAMPIVVGPAIMGVLFVMGSEADTLKVRLLGGLAAGLAVGALGGLLLAAARIERWIGGHRLEILSKVTGVILAALAAQMVFTGVSGFLGGGIGP